MTSRQRKIYSAGISILLALSLLVPAFTVSAQDSVTPGIACGDNHILALQDDGTVWAWGVNTYGQIGNGTSKTVTEPLKVMTGAQKVFAYGETSFALKNNKVWAWGRNWKGDLYTPNVEGRGNATAGKDSSVPKILSNLGDVQSISVAYPTAIALTTEGKIVDFSASFDTGIFDYTRTTQPARFADLAQVKAIAAGNGHGLALLKNGTVWGWGKNDRGQVGNDIADDTIVYTPQQVPTLHDVVDIAAGNKYSLALKNDGTVWAWGDNSNCQLGSTLSDTPILIPTRVKNIPSIVDISGGYNHCLALTDNGRVVSWGDNSYGQLGNSGAPLNKGLFAEDATNLNNVCAISAGSYISAAVTNDDSIWVWGRNDSGQLGIGSFVNQKGPANVKLLALGVPVTDFYLSQTQYSLTTKSPKLTIVPTIKPDNATNKNITWSSSDPAIAEVDSNGGVSPKRVGNCSITAVSMDTGRKVVCAITVGVPVKGIIINPTIITLTAGGSAVKIKPTVIPMTAINKSIKWTTSNPKVAVVDWFGNVKPVGVGTATITAQTEDGGYKAVCKVTVKAKSLAKPTKKSSKRK